MKKTITTMLLITILNHLSINSLGREIFKKERVIGRGKRLLISCKLFFLKIALKVNLSFQTLYKCTLLYINILSHLNPPFSMLDCCFKVA